METTLKALHQQWNELTDQQLKYGPAERMWFDFVNNGFTADDLKTVLTFMFHQNRKRDPKYRDRIQFHRIVGDLETFNSRLAEALAWSRNRVKPPTEKARTVAAFRGEAPVVEQPGSTRHISEVFKALQ